jgi:hypothetical protein
MGGGNEGCGELEGIRGFEAIMGSKESGPFGDLVGNGKDRKMGEAVGDGTFIRKLLCSKHGADISRHVPHERPQRVTRPRRLHAFTSLRAPGAVAGRSCNRTD